MKRTIRAGITGALLIGGVGGLTAIAGSGVGQPIASNDFGVDPAPFLERSPFGTLELRTDPNGGLEIAVAEIGEDPVVVPLSPRRQDRCKVDLEALGEQLDLEVVTASLSTAPDPDTGDRVLSTDAINPPSEVGLVDQGLGSREQNNCNRSNGRLEPGHAFVITLGSQFEDVVFDYGVLDIEAKFGADLFAQTSLGGEVIETYDDENLLPNTSDNDPDAQGSDNNLVPIGAEPDPTAAMGPVVDDFDQLVILPTSDDGRGQISLEGGGDYAAAGTSADNRTVFHLVRSKTYEYALVCSNDERVDEEGSVQSIDETWSDENSDWDIDVSELSDTGYPDQVEVFRYAGYQADGETLKDCPPVGVDLSADVDTADDDRVQLLPSTDNVNLRARLTWVVPAELLDSGTDPFARKIDMDGPGDGGYEDAQYCESFSGDPWSPANPSVPVHPTYADGQSVPWCILTDERVLDERTITDGTTSWTVDVVVQTMIWDGLGDPYWN